MYISLWMEVLATPTKPMINNKLRTPDFISIYAYLKIKREARSCCYIITINRGASPPNRVVINNRHPCQSLYKHYVY